MTAKLRIHGGEPVRTAPLRPWPSLRREQAERLVAALVDGPWACRQVSAPPGGVLKDALEQSFAALVGTRHALAVSSGTTALDLVVERLPAGERAVVVAANYGHPSTVRRAAERYHLLLLDVCKDSLCLDPGQVRDALRQHDVGCVITTHFAGQPAGAHELRSICQEAGVPLLEDGSHAHGARGQGGAAGSFGWAACFSLHASKNLPAGEGGIITTDSDVLYEQLWRAHDLGRDKGSAPYDFVECGGNYRLSEANAGLALAMLPRLEPDAQARMARVAESRSALAGGPLTLLPVAEGVTLHTFHIVAATYDPAALAALSRQRFVLALNGEGIPCSTGWPRALSALPGLASRCIAHPTPVTDAALERVVWLDARLFDEREGPGQLLEAVHKIQQHARGRGRA